MSHDISDLSSRPNIRTGECRCLNCDELLTGQFCACCGQKDIGARLDSRLMLHTLLHAVMDIDSRLWRTLRDMVRKPGHVALKYISGARATYINPIQFMLATFAIYIGFLAANGWLDYGLRGAIDVDPDRADELSEEFQAYWEALSQVLREQMDILTFVSVPIFTFVIRWQYFLARRNFAETLTFVCFIFGQIQLYSLLIAIIQYVVGMEYMGSQGWVTFVVFAMSSKVFFVMKWWKTVLATIVSMVLFSIIRWGVGSGLAYLKLTFS